MSTLKNHPFAVEAFFNASLVLTYAVPKAALEQAIPECLQLDLFKDEWAFIAAAFVDTSHLRPKGFPEFLGNDFFLAGYRIFVNYRNNQGKRLRGLYILRSETNKAKMSFLGNIFTHYNYLKTDIQYHKDQEKISIFSNNSDLDIQALLNKNAPLPASSPFSEWKEARRFAGPLPFTFSYNNKTKKVLTIQGVRENWEPSPVEITKNKIGFIDRMNIPGMVLANAFLIQNIPYHWEKGKTEIWKE
ncbi:MAG TPA: DUF2071 domain-containing protein [Puia sp.]|nr:DUF2071 domain-containing protein [Puia sp.]